MTSLLLAVIYLAFISLGLPDSLLGSAWPTMHAELQVSVSWAGIISMIIALGTVISSLLSDRLIYSFGTGKITAVSVGMTAAALFGFSISHSFVALCLWAIPYGLGAGSVDAALNHYVALHYESRHMSWLHCMWGIGASLGPYIMGYALAHSQGWSTGYRVISLLQIVLSAIVCLSLPLWQKSSGSSTAGQAEKSSAPLPLRRLIVLPGVREIAAAFFCYCALESTAGLWASSYLVFDRGLSAELAASLASLFYIGITAGRAVSGFLTIWLDDQKMIRLGQGILACGIILLLLTGGSLSAEVCLILIGLGCAPIYPCVIHSTPSRFGSDHSQAVIGLEMASAYVGNCLMPPLFGWIVSGIGISSYPYYLLAILAVMVWLNQRAAARTEHRNASI